MYMQAKSLIRKRISARRDSCPCLLLCECINSPSQMSLYFRVDCRMWRKFEYAHCELSEMNHVRCAYSVWMGQLNCAELMDCEQLRFIRTTNGFVSLFYRRSFLDWQCNRKAIGCYVFFFSLTTANEHYFPFNEFLHPICLPFSSKFSPHANALDGRRTCRREQHERINRWSSEHIVSAPTAHRKKGKHTRILEKWNVSNLIIFNLYELRHARHEWTKWIYLLLPFSYYYVCCMYI